jgi:hypothetical protein
MAIPNLELGTLSPRCNSEVCSMKLYWSLQDIPELAPLSQRQRREAWQECYQTYAFKHWQVHLSLGLFSGLVTVSLPVGVAATVVAAVLGGLIYQQTVMHTLRPRLKQYIAVQIQDS